jgi:hypothetical protein
MLFAEEIGSEPSNTSNGMDDDEEEEEEFFTPRVSTMMSRSLWTPHSCRSVGGEQKGRLRALSPSPLKKRSRGRGLAPYDGLADISTATTAEVDDGDDLGDWPDLGDDRALASHPTFADEQTEGNLWPFCGTCRSLAPDDYVFGGCVTRELHDTDLQE